MNNFKYHLSDWWLKRSYDTPQGVRACINCECHKFFDPPKLCGVCCPAFEIREYPATELLKESTTVILNCLPHRVTIEIEKEIINEPDKCS